MDINKTEKFMNCIIYNCFKYKKNLRESSLGEDSKNCNHTQKYTEDRKSKMHRQLSLYFK